MEAGSCSMEARHGTGDNAATSTGDTNKVMTIALSILALVIVIVLSGCCYEVFHKPTYKEAWDFQQYQWDGPNPACCPEIK